MTELVPLETTLRTEGWRPLARDARKGTPCLVVQDAGRAICYSRTRSKPWRMTCGQWVVALEGRTGGYALERIFALAGA